MMEFHSFEIEFYGSFFVSEVLKVEKKRFMNCSHLCCASVLWKCILFKQGDLGVSLFNPLSTSSDDVFNVSDTNEVLTKQEDVEVEDVDRCGR